MRILPLSRTPAWLLAALLTVPALVLPEEAKAETVVFSDSFGADPATSGKWRTYRGVPDPGNESAWDSAAGTLYLTRAVNDRATAIFADHALTAKRWTAGFRYRTGGGSGGDGFVFMFYKDERPFTTAPPSGGSSLGFVTGGGPPSLGPVYVSGDSVPGYGVAFDEFPAGQVCILKDTPTTLLPFCANDARVGDNVWHAAAVEFDNGNVRVKIDGAVVLAVSLPPMDYTYAGVGFSAGTGGSNNDHVIDDFQLSTPGSPPQAKLPSTRIHASAVWTGTHAYVFGGETWVDTGNGGHAAMVDEIVRYDPATDGAAVMAAKLPAARTATSAVWTGTYAYIFGGIDAACFCQTRGILRYDPATGAVATMGGQLPDGVEMTSAVWTGTHAYVFGGFPLTSKIVRYDPATDTATAMTATLPQPLYGTSAVWTGTHAYVFGGSNNSGLQAQSAVLRYDPATDTLATMSATLPTPRALTSAVWSGSHAYVFGGHDGSAERAEILRYDPANAALATMAQALPTGRHLASAAWDGTRAHVFGGYDGSYLDEIVHYTP